MSGVPLDDRKVREDISSFPPDARRYVERLQAIIERDRTEVARCALALERAVVSRAWMKDSRGSYLWDDDHFQSEFGQALDEIDAAIEPLKRIGRNLRDS